MHEVPAVCVATVAMQLSAIDSMPVLAKALEIQTYGVRPAKTPTPPRTCCAVEVPGFQLKPMRGDHTTDSFGVTAVLRPMALKIWELNDGVSSNDGLSARRPNVSVRFGIMCH